MAKLYTRKSDGTYVPNNPQSVTNIDIVQTTGTSVTAAMSQDVVTKELATKQDALTAGNGISIVGGVISSSVAEVVDNIVNAGYVFAGVATPSTDPGTPNAKVFYIANGKGTYTNFGGVSVTEDDVVVLKYDTAWSKVATGIASQEKLTELDNKIANLKSVLSEFTTLPVELQTGYYDRYHDTLQPSEAYKSAKINVRSGEKYSISTKVNASTSLAMIIEFNGDAMSGYVNAGTSSVQTFSDEIYIVPSGVTSIAVTSYQSEPIIKKEELETSLVSDVKDNASKVETLSVKIEELRKGELTKNLKNVLENGNFASTSKMIAYYATMSAANNILTCVGDGSNATPMLINTTSVSYTPDKKFALFLRVRVTNDVCTRIIIEIAGGNGVLVVAAPIKDKWYDVCVNHLEATYTGSAFDVKFYYADAATANEKTGQIKDAVLFEYSEILGATYPVYKLMNIYKNNVWWNGSKDVIVDNFVSEDVINHFDNGYLLPCPNAYAATKRPIVTFINDDGWADDYTKLVAISQKYNVPFVSALFDGSTIKAWYCLYLQNELGWEMASHPRNTALADLSTEEEIEQAILETNEYLTSRGLKYHNLVYPYGSNDERVRRIAKKYYRCACTTDVGINTGVVGSFNLKRYPLGYGGSDSTNTLENLKAQVDACVANNGWLIFMLHPHMPEHTTALTETIASLIEYIQSIGVEIMTLNDGYNVHGNALECGDYTGGSSGIAIGFDGNMANI